MAAYYVKNGGSDSATGLSDTLAWATIAKVNATTLAPGDTIYFKRGSEWREQLTISQSGTESQRLTFTAYGTGDLPIINGANIITGWANIGSNVWSVNSPNTTFLVVVINGVLFTQVATLGEVSSASTYFIDTTPSPDKLYVYSTVDPGTVTSEVSARDYGIAAVNQNYLTISYLDVRNAGRFGIALTAITGGVLEGYCIIDGVNAYRNRLSGIELIGNDTTSYFTHNLVTNCTVTYNGNGIVLWEHIDDSVISYCYSANNIHNWTTGSGDSDGSGFQLYISNNSIVEYCESHGDHTPIYLDPYNFGQSAWTSVIHTARYNRVYDNQYGAGGIMGAAPAAGGKTYIYYNLVVNCGYGTAEVSPIHLQGSESGDMYVYNNTIYVSVDAVRNVKGTIYIQYGTANRHIKNNISYYVPSGSYANFTAGAANLESDYNQWYRNYSGGNIFWINPATGYTTLAAWTAASGEDANSAVTDPLFVNNASDWRLQPTSPCIHAGTIISAIPQVDIAGNPVYGNPSMGCYEYWPYHVYDEETQYAEYTDPGTGFKYRDGVRSASYVIDKELVLYGFTTDVGGGEGEDVDWENVQTVV